MRKLLIAIFALLLTANGLVAQEEEESASDFDQDVTNYDAGELRTRKQLKLAKRLEREGSAINAIIYYERVYEVKPKKHKVLKSLADLNGVLRDYQDAEKWYKKLAAEWESKYPDSRYHYATMLKHNEKYDESTSQFNKFLKDYSGKDKETYKAIVDVEVEGSNKKDEIAEINPDAKVELLGDDVNTYGQEYGPRPYGEDGMIYAAIKTDSAINLDKESSYYSKFYESVYADEVWTNSKPFASSTSEEGFHSANAAFSRDGQIMYFTKCGEDLLSVNRCKIFYAEKINKGWGNPQEIGEVNDANSTNTHPSLGIDKDGNEVLIFVSDREGGQGGMDLWYSVNKNGSWGSPRNMGSKVNTARDEITPFYDFENEKLYFSSNGHPNIGGLDIFSIEGAIKGKGWPEAVNHEGTPLSSPADDFYLALDEKGVNGFIMSNRVGSRSMKGTTTGDDIYGSG